MTTFSYWFLGIFVVLNVGVGIREYRRKPAEQIDQAKESEWFWRIK